ncbi:hypothetical protein JTE90_005851 [Oedothorax gibbosus]|uniref:Profilin n=1 Tax=Oedothorax gibbosus TaxID=931172 RepID=A0AAV6UR90_9ARAC|nr:hypothetical protein JTE90_005851 [Oedothorax gibbosus]
MARQLTDARQGSGKCIFAALHSREEGTCLGRYPKDGPQINENEISLLNKAFLDPTMLYSSGIPLRGKKFTYVKVEENNALMGKTSTQACIVMKTDDVYIICIYPGSELSKDVFLNCRKISEKIKNSS